MRLRIGAMVLGFIGAIGGYTLGILALTMGVIFKELGELFEFETEGLATISMAFLPLTLMGVIGAAISLAKPRAAGILMLLSAIFMLMAGTIMIVEGMGSFSIEKLGIAGGPLLFSSILLFIAGILAIAGRKEES
jgi:hypothetical protein